MAKIRVNTQRIHDYTIRIEADFVYIRRAGNFWRSITISNTLEAWDKCLAVAKEHYPNRSTDEQQQIAAGYAWGGW